MAVTAEQLKAQHGEWNEHKEYTLEDWHAAVLDYDTTSGYWEWVADHINDDLEMERIAEAKRA